MGLITKKEGMLLIGLAVFSALWVAVVIPLFSDSSWFVNLNPLEQYLLFSLGFISALMLIVGTTLSYAIDRDIDILRIVKFGLSFWLLDSFVIDMAFQPPYYLAPSGQVLLQNDKALTGSAVDAMVAWCGQQIGISGPSLYYFTYFLVPLLVLTLLALVLAPKQFLGLFISLPDKIRRKKKR